MSHRNVVRGTAVEGPPARPAQTSAAGAQGKSEGEAGDLSVNVLPSAARRRLVGSARWLTTLLLPDDYLGYVNPLWSTRAPRGRVEAVLRDIG